MGLAVNPPHKRKEETKLHKNTIWIVEKAKRKWQQYEYLYMFTYWYETFALPNFVRGKHGNSQRFCQLAIG